MIHFVSLYYKNFLFLCINNVAISMSMVVTKCITAIFMQYIHRIYQGTIGTFTKNEK